MAPLTVDSPRSARVLWAVWALAVFYLAVVLGLTLSWHTVDSRVGPQLYAVLRWVQTHVGIPVASGYAAVEWLSNVLMFVPLGILARLLLPTFPGALLVSAGVSVSLGVEWVQAVALPERTASMWDVLANGLGMLAGVWVASGRVGGGRNIPPK